MTILLDDYRAEMLQVAPGLAATIDAQFAEAARSLSPAGLGYWLDGARALTGLRRGPELLIAYLEDMPIAARECGEDIIPDCIAAVMKLSSLTSGTVLAQVFATLPTAARRLGDPDLLRAYLQLLHRLAARSPRGLRPMLGCVDELLAKLSLSGLRRWVDFGAEAYRHDLAGQARYFALETDDSRAVLQQERRGTLFIDSQRRLNFYLRAFWGRDFFLRPAAADAADFRPYAEAGALHLPDALDDRAGQSASALYRAMAAHLAAHVAYTPAPLPAGRLSPAQQFFVGLIEDARVEYCAIRDFPGLRQLWRSFHAEKVAQAEAGGSIAVLRRVAACLLDDELALGEPSLDAHIRAFHAEIKACCGDAHMSMTRGLALHDAFAARGAMPSLTELQRSMSAHRDDNRMVWDAWTFAQFAAHGGETAHQRQLRKRVSIMEFVNALDVETAGDDANEVWVLDGVLFDDDGTSWNEREGREPISEPFHYPEWDYRAQLHRPDWTTVYEHRPRRGDPARIEAVVAEHKPLATRIRQLIDRLRPQGITRVRKLEDGDELDLNAAVDAMVALRIGQAPDMRITMRNLIHSRDLAVLILLDLSESTNERVRDSDKTVLALTLEACTLLATAVAGIGDPFAIHGFASDGRHDVRYTRFKDFDQRFDDDARARLAGMQGGLSTRMGSAMRHAGRLLGQQGARRKLLLVITDGEPADIDERDPQTLRQDARKAVEEVALRGVQSYCLTLDQAADQYVERIFGANRYTIVDDVRRLPERLPSLFASLTR